VTIPTGEVADLLAALIRNRCVNDGTPFFRPRGTVSYGVGLFDRRVAFGDFLRMFHGPDERVSEESLGLTTDLIAEVVARFGAATG